MRASQEYTEQKKEQIIVAALKKFAASGYGRVSLDEIASSARIAKGTLYLYFKDKEDLFESTVRYVLDTLRGRARKELDLSAPTLQVLRHLVRIQLAVYQENPEFLGLFFILTDPRLVNRQRSLYALLNERQKELTDFECSLIERGKKEGSIRQDIDSREIAWAFEGMVHYCIHLMKDWGCDPYRTDRSVDVEKATDTMMTILLQGIQKREEV